MGIGISVAEFALGALVSLLMSWVLVTRLERVGERFGLSEALLGMVAALAADTPEITASVTALAHHQRAVGAGVVIGSNVFNLAALLGLGAVVAGGFSLHRKVVLLNGAIAIWVALVCLITISDLVSPISGLFLVLIVLVPYLVLLGSYRRSLQRVPLPRRVVRWLVSAVDEEELELVVAIRPPRGTPLDFLVAVASLVTVVGASVAMERGASTLGIHFGVSEIVVGGLVLAAVTSLPNAVAAIIPGSTTEGGGSTQHRAEQQRIERRNRPSAPGGTGGVGGGVNSGDLHRLVVSGAHYGDSRSGLCRAGIRSVLRIANHRRLWHLRGRDPCHVLRAGTSSARFVRSDRGRQPMNRPGNPGDSIPWKRGWSHGEQADHEAVSA